MISNILEIAFSGYWRKGNVEIFCEWAMIDLHHSKEGLLEYLKNIEWKS